MTARPGISRAEERLAALRAQGLCGPRLAGGATGIVRHLGAVQLDTISVLARSHLLVAWARLGPLSADSIERAYWSELPTTFEYWAHAACIVPLEHWPLFEFRRRASRARGRRWHRLNDADRSCREILARLSSEGPLTATELGGAKGGGPWWDWTEEKIAVEWLLDTGTVVCTRRVGWRRVYDLAERAIPEVLRAEEPSDAECLRSLVTLAGRGLGIATIAELATYYKLTSAQVRSVIADTHLVGVNLEHSALAHYADPAALEHLGAPSRSRTTLLSPFDSLLWDRRRAERIFDIVHRLEAYVPRPKRVHGYYAMPVLANGRIVGRVDPARSGQTLVARRITATGTGVAPAIARALLEAARWVGASTVAIEELSDESLRAPLLTALGT